MGITSFIRRKLNKKEGTLRIKKKQLLELDFELDKLSLFGLDTEFDWRSTYFPKLSMVQISTFDKIFLVDCLQTNPNEILKNT